jgi:hypothetical protein
LGDSSLIWSRISRLPDVGATWQSSSAHPLQVH